MAVLADIRGLNMLWIFTGRIRPVMTRNAVGHIRWMHKARIPAIGGVAFLTLITAGDMRGMLTGSYRPIVATHTVARDTTVIKHGISPVIGIMAIITLGITGNMRGMFTGRNRTVVTGDTAAQHMDMINTQGG